MRDASSVGRAKAALLMAHDLRAVLSSHRAGLHDLRRTRRDPSCLKPISEIAHQWGLGDRAHFSRHYRARFGRTPSDARAAVRATRLSLDEGEH